MNEAEARAYGLIAQAIAQHAFAMAEAQTKHPLSRFEDSFPEARRPIYDHIPIQHLKPLHTICGDWVFLSHWTSRAAGLATSHAIATSAMQML